RIPQGAFYEYPSNGFILFDLGILGDGYYAPLAHVRTDLDINIASTNLNFGGFSDLNLADNSSNFPIAVRWTGSIFIADAGVTTFFLESNEASRLKIDGQQVIMNGGPHPTGMTEVGGSVTLTAGYHDIVIDYVNSGG